MKIKTKEQLRSEIFEYTQKNIPQVNNYRGGSVFRLILETLVHFLWKLYEEIKTILPNLFTQTAEGTWLDEKAAELGLQRQQAKKAERTIKLIRTNTIGFIIIPKGKIFCNKGLTHNFLVKNDVRSEDGESEIKVSLVAENPGSQYNNTVISVFKTPIRGIERIDENFYELTEAGIDKETDELLRERCISLWQGLSGANASAYISWAKQIDGVQNAKIIETARGLGTVDIIITAEGNSQASPGLIAKVQDTLNKNKPIGTDLQVKNPRETLINTQITVVLLSDKKTENHEIYQKIENYFQNMSIGEDFEPSALIAKIFELDNIKSVVIATPAQKISDFEIVRCGTIELEVNYVSEI